MAGAVSKCPDPKKFPHAARWFRHLQSYDAEAKKAFAKAKKDDYVKQDGNAAKDAADEEDDVDLVNYY